MRLFVIIPSIRAEQVTETVKSVYEQTGFDAIIAVICGKSAYNPDLRKALEKEFPYLQFADSEPDLPVILPGGARNRGLQHFKFQNSDIQGDDYILMVDDDIILPPDYSITLVNFIQENSVVAAAMGRVVTKPFTTAGRMIDYSNFYYLQTKTNIPDLGWGLTTCTILKYSVANKYRFREDLRVGEDNAFFQEVCRDHGTFGVCSEVTADHLHNRSSFWKAVKYQFTNGYDHLDWQGRYISFLRMFRFAGSLYESAYKINKDAMDKDILLKYMVYFSFLVMGLGVEAGSLRNILKKIN